jgi:hypothetical protein
MHVQPQWAGKHLLPPLIDKKWKEPKTTPCLIALVRRVAKLCDTGLWACHCAEELTLWQIRLLSHREKLAYECLWLADLSCEAAAGKIFNFSLLLLMVYHSDLRTSLFHIVLTQAEINWFVTCLFDKDLLNA